MQKAVKTVADRQKTLMLIVAAMLMACVFTMTGVMSVKAENLNKYKVKIFVGESFKLKLKDSKETPKFKSSAKKTATVSKKGVIRGKRRGSCVITVTAGKNTYKCKVTVVNMKDTNKTEVRKLINKQRRTYGLQSLDYNKYLEKAAQKRAKELDVNYSHTRPNGDSFTSAISMKYDFGVYCYEIIGNDIATPKQIVSAWMNNAGTKAPIIGKGYKDIGVGYYVASDGREFWCVIMAAKK